ncbi:MAG: glycosyltransferase family 4 protein [Thermodesulfobacteriota bacterium]
MHPELNILCFCAYPFPAHPGETLFCGGQYHPFYLTWALAELGVNLHVIARQQPDQPAQQRIKGLTVHRYPSTYHWGGHRRGITFSGKRLRLVMQQCSRQKFSWAITFSPLTRELDLLQQHEISLCYMVPGVNRGFLKNLGNRPLDILRKMAIRHISLPLFKKNIAAAKLIFANCASDANLLTRHFQPPCPVQINRNGVNTQLYRPIPKEERTNTFLCVGRFAREKGFHDTLDAAVTCCRENPSIRFHFIGFIDDRNYFHKIKKQIADLALKNHIDLDPNVPEEKMPSYFGRARALICYSNGYDPLPSVIYQAMACGLPVISTDWPSRSEVIEHEINGLLVPPGRIDLLIQAIRRLSDYEAHAFAMGENARKTVCEKHDFTKLAQDILAHLHRAGHAGPVLS